MDFAARANWWVSSLSQTCLKRESRVSPFEEGIQGEPFHDLCNMGREKNKPKILFNYDGWRTFWYRDNYELLKKHRGVSLYHRGIIDISDDW